MVTYTYPLSAIISGKLDFGRLVGEIKATIPVDLSPDTPVSANSEEVSINFVGALSDEQKGTLDTLIANHPRPKANNLASAIILPGELSVTADSEWQFVATIVSRPSFFVSNMDLAVGQILGAYSAFGTGAQIRVMKDNIEIIKHDLEDTAGNFSVFSVIGGQGQLGLSHHQYTLEARRNGATAFNLRGVSFNLLEFY